MELLLNRRASFPFNRIRASGKALALLLRRKGEAIREPDPGALQPWRFIIITGKAMPA
ncbi:MAG: hypothetical protein ACTXOO_00720 [Sodalis sp. (in: enterobacteria)]